MKRLIKLAQGHPKTNASALNASASVPASGFPFIDNSTGASAAVAELSKVLGGALEKIDLDGDVSGQITELIERLEKEVSVDQKTQLETAKYPDWKCSAEKAHLVSVAWKCASGAYDPSICPAQHDLTFTQGQAVKPSAEGTVKAMTSTIVSSNTPQSDALPLLVIAIRGSAGAIDHMVNANGRPKSAIHFIDLPDTNDIHCHSGFLNSAKALDSIVSVIIQEYLDKHPGTRQIVFTGHSAGGAVASILYLRQLSKRTFGSSTRFSCITFGAPPCLTIPDGPLQFGECATNEVCINIINEFDLVTRIDEPYVLCLVNLARLAYNRPPLAQTLEVEPTGSSTSNASLCREQSAMPQSLYHHVGLRVIFSIRLDEATQTLCLRAFEVSREVLEGLIFCRLNVHRRTCYEERIQALVEGRLATIG